MSNYLVMLSPTSIREILFVCPPSLPWNLPSFTVESTLSSPCSQSDPPLSCQGAALAHLDFLPSHNIVIWLCSFSFWEKMALVSLLTSCFVAWRPPFPFWQAQLVLVFVLKPALVCKLSTGFGSTNKSAISLLFFFSLTLALSLPLCPLLCRSFYLKLSGRSCLLSPPLLSGYNGSPNTHFSRVMTQLMS